jgi:creatinine amidohydrolase
MFQRYEGVAWEERFLPRLTSKQVKELPKEDSLVILPVGAVEQHGWHLPVMTDTLIGEATLTMALEKLDSSAKVWLIPPVPYGKSNEHIGIPGTISLSAATLLGVITDIADSLQLSGFNKLLLFNTHGGNADILNVIAREIRIRNGMMVFYLSPNRFGAGEGLLTPEEMELGLHGGDYETSVVKAIKPTWVQDELAVRELPDLSKYEYLSFGGKVRFSWTMPDISASGIAGDATLATAEKGQIIMERVTDILAKVLLELCSFQISDVRKGTT